MINRLLIGLLSLIGIVAHSQEKQAKKTYSEDEKLAMVEAKCEKGDSESCENLYFYYLNRKKYDTEGQYIINMVKKLKDLKRPKYVFMWGIATSEGRYAAEIIPQDFLKGMKMVKEAADMDFPPAQMMIADFYSISEDSKGLRKAVYYLNCACESEYTPACETLIALGDFDKRIYNSELREKMWKAFDESGDKYLIRGRYDELRDKLRKEKFINN